MDRAGFCKRRIPLGAVCAPLIIVLLFSPIRSEPSLQSLQSLPTVRIGAVRYFSLNTLAQAFGAHPSRLDPLTQKATLRLNGHECVFTLLSRTVRIDSRAHPLLQAEIRLYKNTVYIPAESFRPFLEQIAPGPLRLPGLETEAPAQKISRTAPLPDQLLGLHINEAEGATRLILETDGHIDREQVQFRQIQDRLTLTIGNARLGRGAKTPPKKGYIRKISLKAQKDSVRIELRIHKDAVQNMLTKEEGRFILSLEPSSWTFNTIVIDPGHGGKDPGAIGRGGTKEKIIALKIAKHLKPLLEKKLGVKAILTRSHDTFVPLHERAQIARRHTGKLFVSIHCNAARRRGAQGWEIYFLSQAKTAEAAEVARRENASLQFEASESGVNIEDRIKSQLLSTQFLKESQDLAAAIKHEVGHISNLKNLGVKQANFYVMKGTMGDMPSVLVECGFLSNTREEKRLRSSQFQKQMAEAIYRGIKAFKHQYERSLTKS